MRTLDLGGVGVDVTDEGFFVHPEQWTRAMAAELADREGVRALSDVHWAVVDHLRTRFLEGARPPTARQLSKHCGISVRALYEAFPERPVKTAAKVGGLPEPCFFLGGCLSSWGTWPGRR
jgi:TusE/DsrC/DsvC family sulfur relay protein